MRNPAIAVALACLGILGLVSCESVKTYYAAARGPLEFQSYQTGKSAPRAETASRISEGPKARTEQPRHRHVPTAAARKYASTKAPESMSTPSTVAPAPSSESVEISAPAGPTATMTLSAGGNDSARARELLDSARSRLARVDRKSLAPDQIQLYDQVSGFISAGRQALEVKDVNAASGFAGKASQLALKLKESPNRD